MPPREDRDGLSWDEYRLWAEREFARLSRDVEGLALEVRSIATEQTMTKGKAVAYGIVASVVLTFVMAIAGKYI